MYACMYVCLYVYVCIRIYIYIKLHTQKASSIADVLTNSGCITFSSAMLLMHPLRTFTPAYFSPAACRRRSSETIWRACAASGVSICTFVPVKQVS
jgi:hypothetical protein